MSRATLPDDLVVLPAHLTGEALLDAQRELMADIDADERELARVYARMMRNRAEVARLWGVRSGKGLMELAGSARIGQDKAHRQVVDGVRLTECFPQALLLLEAGRMHVGTVQLLLSLTKHLSAALQARVGDQVVREIAGLDAADARQVVVTAMAELVAADEARAAHERARAQRGVWVKPVEDGMARIGAEVDAVSGRRFALDFEELVRAQKVLDDRTGRQRTTQQRRADVLAELPSRHLALVRAMQQGKTEALLTEARARWETNAACASADTREHPDRSARPPTSPAAGSAAAASPDPTSRDTMCPAGELAEAPAALTGDALVAALLALPVRNPVLMHVHTPVTTVLDLDNRSAVIEGLGVVPAFQARLLRPVASLARLWVDARSGVPLGLDPDPPEPPPDPNLAPEDAAQLVRQRLLGMLRPTAVRDEAEPRHDPSSRLRRLVEVRDVRCDGPGCPMPARACELDHEHAWAHGGVTAVWNLKARSPRCHHGKHDGWTVTRHPDGSSTWTSPTGRTYHRRGAWRPPALPEGESELLEPRPDTLDDTDPREDWHLPLWRSEDPPPF